MNRYVPAFHPLLSLLLCCVCPLLAPLHADDTLYQQRVQPILKQRCYACHGALKQEAGLRLDTVADMQSGGDSGAAMEPGEAEASLIVQRISALDEEERMPPEGEPLSVDAITMIRDWIAAGAVAPAADAREDAPDAHWAFVPPVATPIPNVPGSEHSIDAFLSALRQSHDLQPVSVVSPELLFRRVYLDLVGLPPTEGELHAFLADARPDAYERVVDALLSSSQYGERWGRHWMDVWRYSDWYGLGEQLRYSQKHIWHWRDWIIESLNHDKGYDQMILEMLAGDELAPTDPQVLRATGFLARNYYLFNRTTWLDSTIEHTSSAFLGLTVHCAKCHDHKYDPISHVDYYRMRAIFEPHQVRLDPLPGTTNLEVDGIPRAFCAHPEEPTYRHIRGDEKNPDTQHTIGPGVPAFFQFATYSPQPIPLPLASYLPESQKFVLDDRLQEATRAIDRARSELDALTHTADNTDEALKLRVDVARKRLAAALLFPGKLSSAYHAEIALATADQAHAPAIDVLSKGASIAAKLHELALAEVALAEAKWQQLGAPASDDAGRSAQAKVVESAMQQVEQRQAALATEEGEFPRLRASRKALEGPDETEESQHQRFPRQSTGRRTAFARWIVDRQNPLTARVAINHIWLRHFGQPLVESMIDFGRRAKPPVQQNLLDWLAVELQRQQWRMKPIHRLIVTSQAYRLATGAASEAMSSDIVSPQARDPENQYYWRRNPVRMESQVVRDTLLYLADDLQHQLGGPSVDPSKPSARRSLYFLHSRDQQDKLLAMFDDADILRCYRRSESVVPQQALALANSRLALDAARRIAKRIESDLDQHKSHDPERELKRKHDHDSNRDDEFAQAAFLRILGRFASEDELGLCREALGRWRTSSPTPADGQGATDTSDVSLIEPYGYLVHALLNHNDFITVR